jgi:hypothetical protein
MKDGLIVYENGNKFWYKNGKWNSKESYVKQVDNWLIKGVLHREDGPAVKWPDGRDEWWLDNFCYGGKKPKNWKKLVLTSRAKRLLDK